MSDPGVPDPWPGQPQHPAPGGGQVQHRPRRAAGPPQPGPYAQPPADGLPPRGREIVPAQPAQPPVPVVAPKNPVLYLILSLFIPGVGTMAAGKAWEGVFILVAYIVACLLCLVIIGFILVPAVWIWGMVDAYRAAQKWNAAHGIIS
jgi:TM2 domain-containing membrane protein YozV